MIYQKRDMFLLVMVLLICLLSLLFYALDINHHEVPSPMIGRKIERIEGVVDLANNQSVISTPSVNGKPTLVHFWAFWCESCIKELATFKSTVGNDVNVIAIHPYSHRPSLIIDTLLAYDHPFEHIWMANDPSCVNSRDTCDNFDIFFDLGVVSFPETILLDQDFHIQQVYRGVLTQEIWHEKFDPFLYT